MSLKIADVVKDAAILYKARNAAKELLNDDPNLLKPENEVMQRVYAQLSRKSGIWSNIS